MTFILGLTGSIGMGKSTTANMFRMEGVPIHDADAIVHELYQGRAVALIKDLCPEAMIDKKVDRALLGQWALKNPAHLLALEALIHPLVEEEEASFLEKQRRANRPLVVFDIPLLFEVKAEKRCHAIVVVTASPALQRARVLARPNMTEARFAALLQKQIPDAVKQKQAHFIVETGSGLDHARRQVKDIVMALAGCCHK
jgi:dephospho-CoA kinase